MQPVRAVFRNFGRFMDGGEGRVTRKYTYKPGMRERVSERMRKMNSDPVFAAAAEKRASLRMRQIHAAARAVSTPKP